MASSTDEAAALKRNVVHQTRLKLALRQLDRDRSIRIREINKDTQVFLHRLGESKRKIGLPDLKVAQPRAASAPVSQKGQKGAVGLTTSGTQVSNYSFATKPSYQATNDRQRFRRFNGSRTLNASPFCLPTTRNGTPSRDQETRTPTRTPREITISPRSDQTQKEVRFSLPIDHAHGPHGEDRLETPRIPSPIVSKGIALMRIKNPVDRPSRTFSASQARSKYL